MKKYIKYLHRCIVGFLLIYSSHSYGQTDMDAIMMHKQQFCSGFTYVHSSWDQYWEGTLKRNNLNLGTVTTQTVMAMANYGIKDNLNIMVGAPYVWTNVSAGTMSGLNGVQDISLWIKWRAIHKDFGKNKISVFGLGGFSTPLSDYVIDMLPMSIGLGATTLSGRLMVDYQYKKFSVTGSATYVGRSNVTLDRDSYFDTELRQTNEVKMPDAMQFQLRAGFRGKYLLAEALLSNWTTLGGFDITHNNVPFPSNRMNSTAAGFNLKYTLPFFTSLSVLGGMNYTVAGRNVGQSLAINTGLFYGFYFGKNHSTQF
jgi:hypothetical protein